MCPKIPVFFIQFEESVTLYAKLHKHLPVHSRLQVQITTTNYAWSRGKSGL
jgi:hypothetical protein